MNEGHSLLKHGGIAKFRVVEKDGKINPGLLITKLEISWWSTRSVEEELFPS